jgi:CHAT domain-containing protein
MWWRVPKARLALCLSLFLATGASVILSRLYADRNSATNSKTERSIGDSGSWQDPQRLLAEANHFSWVWNGPRAEPLYARAEEMFKKSGDKRDEIYAHVGELRARSETMSYTDVSEMIGRELTDPVVKSHPRLKLWCLAQKGYTDIEISPALTKWDWSEAREIAKKLGEKQWVARADGELGTVAFLQGQSRAGAKLVGEALVSAMASGDTGGEVRFLEMLGNGFNTVQRYPEALAFFDHAIAVSSETPDEGFSYMAFEGKAQALYGEKRYAEAREALNHALAVARKDEKFSQISQIYIQLAEIDLETGQRGEATTLLEQAGKIGWDHAFYRMADQAYFELANLCIQSANLKCAESYARQGLEASRRLGDRFFLPRDLTALADLKAREGQIADANGLYEQAEDVIDGMLVNVDEPYWSSALAGAMSETYLHHFELTARTGTTAKALNILERVRGRTAAALLEDRVAFTQDESPAVQELEATVSNLQLRLMRSESESERTSLNEKLIEYERRLDWTVNGDDATRSEWLETPASLKSIQSVLDGDEIALEYVLDEPEAFCVWITEHEEGLIVLPAGRQRIESLTRSFLNSIQTKKYDARAAEELYSILVRPISGAKSHDKWIIVPDGRLYSLPFDTLRDRAGSYLARSKTISYVPALTVLSVLRTRKAQIEPQRLFLGVGDVLYQDQGDVSSELPKARGFEKALLRGLSDTLSFPTYDLPQTRAEVLGASKILGNRGVVLLGSHATDAAFKSEPLADFRIVHLAVHGFADSRFPERSGLVLGKASGDDGLLQIPEIMRLHFNADLITLSACDTGIGKVEGEEGITDLAEAFLVSGARAVVASLWSADDTFTSDLMKRFYTHLARGEDKATALRDAKIDLLNQYGNQVSPYYWGAFVLIGDGGSPIPLN